MRRERAESRLANKYSDTSALADEKRGERFMNNATELAYFIPKSFPLAEKPYDVEKVQSAHAAFLKVQEETGFYQIDDILVVATPGVYHPTVGSSTLFMLKHLPAIENADILEIGTGSGTIGLHYARRGNAVALADIDPEAIRCAGFNALINRVSVELHLSDVFDNVPEDRTFDVVIFNLPYYQREHTHRYDIVGCDPGGSIAQRFLRDLSLKLRKTGTAYVTYSNLGDISLLRSCCERYHWRADLVAKEVDEDTNVERYLISLNPI